MSFTDRQTSYMIGTGAVISGTPTAIDETATLNEEGWDQLVILYAHRVAELTPEACAAAYPQGAQIGSRKWWISSARPVRKAPGFWLAEVTCKGWAAASKPAKIRTSAAAEQQSGENIVITAVGTFEKVQTHQNTPTISITYLVEDVTDSGSEMTSKVGTAVTPPVTIDVPANVWTSLSPFLYHFPNGWVLMNSEQDRLPGATAALVTDSYKYVQAYSPG